MSNKIQSPIQTFTTINVIQQIEYEQYEHHKCHLVYTVMLLLRLSWNCHYASSITGVLKRYF